MERRDYTIMGRVVDLTPIGSGEAARDLFSVTRRAQKLTTQPNDNIDINSNPLLKLYEKLFRVLESENFIDSLRYSRRASQHVSGKGSVRSYRDEPLDIHHQVVAELVAIITRISALDMKYRLYNILAPLALETVKGKLITEGKRWFSAALLLAIDLESAGYDVSSESIIVDFANALSDNIFTQSQLLEVDSVGDNDTIPLFIDMSVENNIGNRETDQSDKSYYPYNAVAREYRLDYSMPLHPEALSDLHAVVGDIISSDQVDDEYKKIIERVHRKFVSEGQAGVNLEWLKSIFDEDERSDEKVQELLNTLNNGLSKLNGWAIGVYTYELESGEMEQFAEVVGAWALSFVEPK